MALPRRVFIIYAHEDDTWRTELGKTLRPLESDGTLEIWHDRKIPAGAVWNEEIDEQLDQVDRSRPFPTRGVP